MNGKIVDEKETLNWLGTGLYFYASLKIWHFWPILWIINASDPFSLSTKKRISKFFAFVLSWWATFRHGHDKARLKNLSFQYDVMTAWHIFIVFKTPWIGISYVGFCYRLLECNFLSHWGCHIRETNRLIGNCTSFSRICLRGKISGHLLESSTFIYKIYIRNANMSGTSFQVVFFILYSSWFIHVVRIRCHSRYRVGKSIPFQVAYRDKIIYPLQAWSFPFWWKLTLWIICSLYHCKDLSSLAYC